MGKGLVGPNGERGGKVEVGFDIFRGGGEEIRNYGGNVEEEVLYLEDVECVKDSLGRGRRSGKKSLMGSMLIAKGEDCLHGWVGAGGREVKDGGVDLRVTKSLLGETPEESGGEEFRVDERAI
nr:hypothetical protein [Tanacetum cinerariifolium]